MRRRGKVDSTQAEVVAALRALGCTVQSLADVGDGVPDLLVGVSGVTLLLEVKDGRRCPSERRLTPAQQAWHRRWRGNRVLIVESTEDAVRLVNALRAEEHL